jgi:hypothetical protein
MGKNNRKGSVVRFAVGEPSAPRSSVWCVVCQGEDVYLGTRTSMGISKLSLHQSGRWRFAFTTQSGMTIEGNRLLKRWLRRDEYTPGITRGPSFLFPYLSAVGSRTVLNGEKIDGVSWIPAPRPGRLVDVAIYFVAKGSVLTGGEETLILDHRLASGNALVILASERTGRLEYLEFCNKLVQDSPVTYTGDAKANGSILWASESVDDAKIPLLTELTARVLPSAMAALPKPQNPG